MVWATENRGGVPAGVVHIEWADDVGRPFGPACGVSAHGLFWFHDVPADDVPPWWWCETCAGVIG